MKFYLGILHEEYAKNCTNIASNINFRLGNGECVKSIKFLKIPSLVGRREVFIETDVIDGDLPLLLSKGAMKNAQMQIDFTNVITIFGQPQKFLIRHLVTIKIRPFALLPTCLENKKTPPRPVAGLSQPHAFNKTVAMDLKEWTEGSSKT